MFFNHQEHNSSILLLAEYGVGLWGCCLHRQVSYLQNIEFIDRPYFKLAVPIVLFNCSPFFGPLDKKEGGTEPLRKRQQTSQLQAIISAEPEDAPKPQDVQSDQLQD